jgi:hypothetical protein
LEQQMSYLRHFLSLLAQGASQMLTSGSQTLVPLHMQGSLSDIKREIAETLRRVVDVVGRYAGVFLTEDARARVRSFILSLPSRWASLHAGHVIENESVEAQRILAFTTEASTMLRAIQEIFTHSLETAQNWIGTLGKVPFVNSLVAQHQMTPLSPSISNNLANMTLASPVPSPRLSPRVVPLPGSFERRPLTFPSPNQHLRKRRPRTPDRTGESTYDTESMDVEMDLDESSCRSSPAVYAPASPLAAAAAAALFTLPHASRNPSELNTPESSPRGDLLDQGAPVVDSVMSSPVINGKKKRRKGNKKDKEVSLAH